MTVVKRLNEFVVYSVARGAQASAVVQFQRNHALPVQRSCDQVLNDARTSRPE